MGKEAARFAFIGHALRGDGPFRPAVSLDTSGRPLSVGTSYLIQYPRESTEKFARRNELAFYASPMQQAASRFTGYLSTRTPARDLPHQLFNAIADDADGKGNAIDVFWQEFMAQAKARGSMCMLVDNPATPAASQAEQMAARSVPIWTPIAPELLTDYEVGDDGRFVFAEFSGTYSPPDGAAVPCTWHFDHSDWWAIDREKRKLAQGAHPLGQCPLLIFTEGGDFPHFGPFAAIADLSKRLFNLDSELDEILRGQTFSLLTMQVPDNSTGAQRVEAATAAGATIGTNNLMVHSGSTPAFIAPPDGPARIYLDRINALRAQIDEIGLNVATPAARESGIALQMRFQSINAELSRFAGRMEDFERQAWDLSRRWLGMSVAPVVRWARDYGLLDVLQEMQILTDMQAAGMPDAVIVAQRKRIVTQQFQGLDQAEMDDIIAAVDEALHAPARDGNVIPLRPDPNADVRDAIVKALNG